MSIRDNLERIIEQIENSRRHSLTNGDVELIAVTKTRTIEEIQEVIDCGQLDIGENKVQELRDKIDLLKNSSINYHMIGNLQTNKVKYIYDKIKLIHSLDRINLVEEINKRAKKDNIYVDCLVEVNIAGEQQKGGVEYNKVQKFIEECMEYENVNIKGLMTVAPNTNDEVYLRNCFRKMFELNEKIKNSNYEKVEMKHLSMGMSGDFEIAIEEGSNMVRIGTSIFGNRN